MGENETLAVEALQTRPLMGLVLAGGLSSRMSLDKTQLVFQDQPLYQLAFSKVKKFCTTTYVSCRADQVSDFSPIPCLIDRYDRIGPLGGLATAIEARSAAAWLVLAADLPLVSEALLDDLIRARQPKAQVTLCKTTTGQAQPLCAIYEPTCRSAIRSQIAQGTYAMMDLLQVLECNYLIVPDQRSLTNINTRSAWEQLQKSNDEESV